MATLPNQRTWVPGLVPSAHFNSDIRDTYAFLLNPPLCMRRFDSSRGLGYVEWQNDVIDTDGAIENVYNYKAKTAGWYHMTLWIKWKHEFDHKYLAFQGFEAVGSPMYQSSNRSHTPFDAREISYTTVGNTYLDVGDHVAVRCWFAGDFYGGGFKILQGEWIIKWVSK